MDTERYFKATEENLDNIANYLEGTEEELKVIIDYVEITRHIQEIHQWYEIFMYSLDQLKKATWYNNKIGINTYLISLIRAGKTIADSMSLCIEKNYGKEERLFISKEYDNSFSYKFLIRLRNYSQHGHIPVSIIENRPKFDLMQIYNTPHYEFNNTLRKEVEDFIKFIHKNHDCAEGPMLDFESTVCSYTCSIFRIYKKFLEKICVSVEKYRNEIQLAIKEKPEIIKHGDKRMDGWIFYVIKDVDDKNIQAVDAASNPNEMISMWKNEVIDTLKKENRILKEMTSKSIPVGNFKRNP